MTRLAISVIALLTTAASAARPNGSDADAPDFEALRHALADLIESFGDRYPNGSAWARRASGMEAAWRAAADEARSAIAADFRRLQREAMLANPLFRAQPLLFIRRRVAPHRDLDGRELGLPQNWQGNCALPRRGYTNELRRLDPARPDGDTALVFAPADPVCVADVDLHWDGRRLLFCMPSGPNATWQIFELDLESGSTRPVTVGLPPDVDNYDPCYLPSGDILFASTACVAGVPCVGGSSRVANLFRCGPDGSGVRQLCFDQEHNWCPTALSDGRVMYTRWEYTDTPHYFTRLLFTMNPDGRNQRALYGSNSWWPNSVFYAREIPTQPGRVIAVISGHHGVARMGELVLFDTRRGERDADGALQRIPGRGRPVQPVIADQLVQHAWPKFLHPYPLADAATGAGAGKYFLVSMKPNAQRPWGLYLADIFDNLTLIREEPGWALLEPIPLRAAPRPPVVPDAVDPAATEALILLSDVYAGDAMRSVPRGTVRSLRLFSYHYAYLRTGGHLHIGIGGPWDARRILERCPSRRTARPSSGCRPTRRSRCSPSTPAAGPSKSWVVVHRDAGRAPGLRGLS